MAEMSRHLSGKTFDEELEERARRKNEGLMVRTSHEDDHWKTQNEVRKWFSITFNEWLLWSHAVANDGLLHHFWLPRTKDQAMLLKLTFGG